LIIPYESKTISTNVLLESYSDARLDTVYYEMLISDTSRFEVFQVASLTDNVEIISYNEVEKYLITRVINNIKEGDGFYIELNEKKKNDTIVELSIKPLKINDCSCITNLYGDKQYIRSEIIDTPIVSVEEEKEGILHAYYNKTNEEFVITNNDKEIEEIRIISINGIISDKKEITMRQSEYKINANNYINGVYIIQCSKRNKIKNILLIKY